MDTLKANYDLVSTAATGAMLAALQVTIGLPWPIWAAFGVITAGQIANRIIRGWAR